MYFFIRKTKNCLNFFPHSVICCEIQIFGQMREVGWVTQNAHIFKIYSKWKQLESFSFFLGKVNLVMVLWSGLCWSSQIIEESVTVFILHMWKMVFHFCETNPDNKYFTCDYVNIKYLRLNPRMWGKKNVQITWYHCVMSCQIQQMATQPMVQYLWHWLNNWL